MRLVLKGRRLKIPIVPLSALVFYLIILALWQLGLIPSPTDIFSGLENLYEAHGLLGLFTATVLEGLVYVGLYFPGSTIIFLSVILSEGTFVALLKVSVVVALGLTLTSAVNYYLGLVAGRKLLNRKSPRAVTGKKERGLLLSALHPNALAFYFFMAGIERKRLRTVWYVPLVMVPYGFLLGLVLYLFKSPIRQAIESPNKVIVVLLIWVLVSFVIRYRTAERS